MHMCERKSNIDVSIVNYGQLLLEGYGLSVVPCLSISAFNIVLNLSEYNSAELPQPE